MSAHVQRLCGTFALIAAFVACRDSSTALRGRAAGRTPTFATASDTSGGSGKQSHFNAHGDFANANWTAETDGGFVIGTVGVDRGGPPNDPATFLTYFIEQCDNDFNCILSGGEGLIPNQDLRVSGTSVELNTNIDGNPSFSTFGVIPPGLVSVNWQANGLLQQTFNGTSGLRVPGFMSRRTGISRFASADASGTVAGFSFASVHGNGRVGSNSTVTIDIVH
ncbi:MAG TPA: hypothetical protein VK531_14340 [Gemmatimonadales bacterium]|jgi:hypothetical protein|nr:hypothetical protein [Gemmatimonadales bacterium]